MFIFFLFTCLLFSKPPVSSSNNNSQKPSGSASSNLENSYQIDQQKQQKANLSIGTFYNAKTKRYFKAKYKRISSDKTKISLSPVAGESFAGSKPKKSNSSYQNRTPQKAVEEVAKPVLSKDEIKNLILQNLKKK